MENDDLSRCLKCKHYDPILNGEAGYCLAILDKYNKPFPVINFGYGHEFCSGKKFVRRAGIFRKFRAWLQGLEKFSDIWKEDKIQRGFDIYGE